MEKPAKIAAVCPQCRKTIRAPAAFVGKRVKCKECGESFVVPAAAAGEPAATPTSQVGSERTTEDGNARPPVLATRVAPATMPRNSGDDREDERPALKPLPLPVDVEGLTLLSRECFLSARWVSMEPGGQARCELLLTTKRLIIVKHPALGLLGTGGISSSLAFAEGLGTLARVVTSKSFAHGNKVVFTFTGGELGTQRATVYPITMKGLVDDVNDVLTACHRLELEEGAEGEWDLRADPPTGKAQREAMLSLRHMQGGSTRTAGQRDVMRSGKRFLLPILGAVFTLIVLLAICSAVVSHLL